MRTAQNIAAARGSSNLALFPVDGDEIGRAFDQLLLGRDEPDIAPPIKPAREGSRVGRKSG